MHESVRKDLPHVVLLGRTNVGKSTLFSRVTHEEALISKTPHTTRDAKEAIVEWNHKAFVIVDTGGFDIGKTEPFAENVSEQIRKHLDRADAVIFVIDTQDVYPSEELWIKNLRKRKVPIIIAANKNDRAHARVRFPFAKSKGIPIFPVSSVNGGGVGDLLEEVVRSFPAPALTYTTPHFRMGLIGRTNVGKSALFNALLGEDRAIVSDEHHTTRESLKSTISWEHTVIELVDTAGAQKKAHAEIQKQSQRLTLQTIETCDVLGLVTVAGENPVPRQDLELAKTVLDLRKSLVLIVNKWDRFDDRTPRGRQAEEKRFKQAFSSNPFIPITVVSATERHRLTTIFDLARASYAERFVELSFDQLSAIKKKLSQHITTVKQLAVNPPRFHAICTERSVPSAINDILRKEIRGTHPYVGTPIIVSIAKKGKHHAPRRRAR